MPAENFQGYGIHPGDEISCKIDKINCTGRIYLEPRHPYYSEGKIYDFEIVKISNSVIGSMVVVKEIGGNHLEILLESRMEEVLKAKNWVRCRVNSIKKAPYFLS
ncbi:MAG: hypothetical protein U0Z17_04750 [Bacteroidales bacterium]